MRPVIRLISRHAFTIGKLPVDFRMEVRERGTKIGVQLPYTPLVRSRVRLRCMSTKSSAKSSSKTRKSPPPCTSSVFRRTTAFAASDVVVVLIRIASLRRAPLSLTDRSCQPRASISLRVPDHTRVSPPSTTTSSLVMKDESSDVRKRTTRAISSGDPSRPRGILASSEARAAAAASTESTLSTIPESMGPGLMAAVAKPRRVGTVEWKGSPFGNPCKLC